MDLKSVDCIDFKIYLWAMEQFMAQVREYAARSGVKPSTVVQKAGFAGNAWGRWERDESSPTQRTLDKILRYMLDNPPPEEDRAERVG
ncbi:MAG: hypothetical protein EpisKO_15720 [Epibacterium sp.]